MEPDFFLPVEQAFESLVDVLEQLLFFPVPFPGAAEGLPFLIFWLLLAGIFFTLRLGFANFTLLGHGIKVIMGKYKSEEGDGEISSFQAVATVVSGTVGVGGNIAGVAIAVSVGGPGSVIWIMLAGLLCTANKFAEVIIGHKYRHKDKNGKWNGGAWYYLSAGLQDTPFAVLGKPLAVLFAIFCIGGALGGGNMFQSNQAVAIITDTYPAAEPFEWLFALTMASLVFVVLIGGIKRIAQVAELLVPSMAAIYLLASIVVLIAHASDIPAAFSYMFQQAFTPEAAGGGMIGALIMGLRRAFFSNEAGIGSAPIAHAASRNVDPVREGSVSVVEPIIDSVIICTMTGLVITVTGAYEDVQGMTGVALTSSAFASVMGWFPHLLTICVLLFAFSTALTWSYYGERAWSYLTRGRFLMAYYLLYCSLTFLGGISQLGVVVMFSDLLILAMAIPNMIGLYLMSNTIASEVKRYKAALAQR